jgi:transcriptional regulator with XRE-family HTH domain
MDKTEYGTRVRDARRIAGLSQGELAEKIGFRQSAIGNIEAGRNGFSGSVIKIANALGVSVNWLATGEGQMQPPAGSHDAMRAAPSERLQDRVKEAMDASGMTPAEFSRSAKLSPSAINQLTEGKTKSLRADTAAHIEIATGYSAAWLALGTGQKKVNSVAVKQPAAAALQPAYKPKDSLVAALVELCIKEGGHLRVAKEAKLSTDLLYQIVTGVKLPSGNPKGVGPQTRAALDERYPGWQQASSPTVFEQSAATLQTTLEHLSHFLASVPEADRATASAALAALAHQPETHAQKSALLQLLIKA